MIRKAESPLTDLADWEARAGPKREGQWKDGRSAKESARAWLESGPSMPQEVLEVLQSHPDMGPLKEWWGEPEAQVHFDTFRGPANIDLLIRGRDSEGAVVVAVEAKADETFGDTVRGTVAAAEKRLKEHPDSKGVRRAEELVRAILGGSPSEFLQVRYQLLSATAAAICKAEAQGSSRAVVLIHEFRTDRTSDEKHQVNAEDLDEFTRLISKGAVGAITPGSLFGPFRVPGSPKINSQTRVYFGKAVRALR